MDLEIKLDGYRRFTVKSEGSVTLYSRRKNDFTRRFSELEAALQGLPEGTLIDGELVAFDEQGRPDFELLHNFRSAESRLMFYAFDALTHRVST
jgi:ATP-dependent DNA ligase